MRKCTIFDTLALETAKAPPHSGSLLLPVGHGKEPGRDWLTDLSQPDRKRIGEDIKTAQLGWPLGMPRIRKLAPDLWEVRPHTAGGIARVICTVAGHTMILLHGFIKKQQKSPGQELQTARQRLADLQRE